MNSPQTQFNAARYQLLQRASFWQGDDARANLRAWNAQISWDDHLNADEYRLLPQLARDLSARKIEHAWLGKFRGIARKAWVTNQLFFRALAPTLKKMRDAKIEPLLLYGGAFALRYDVEYPLAYNAADCGILVRAPRISCSRAAAGNQRPKFRNAFSITMSPRAFFTRSQMRAANKSFCNGS